MSIVPYSKVNIEIFEWNRKMPHIQLMTVFLLTKVDSFQKLIH